MSMRKLAAFLLATCLATSGGTAWADIAAARKALAQGDLGAAFAAFTELARGGDVAAQARLAEFYMSGRGTKQSVPDAAIWLRKAADQGHVISQLMLARLLLSGSGIKKDTKTGTALLTRAATAGDAEAQNDLAQLYLRGAGVTKDVAKAKTWFEKAANQGEPDTQMTYGLLHANGLFGAADYRTAEIWIERAAQQGHVPAQVNLAVLQAQGLATGGKPDVVSAYRWLFLASMMGDDRAGEIRDSLKAAMTPAQIAEAKQRAKSWTPKAHGATP